MTRLLLSFLCCLFLVFQLPGQTEQKLSPEDFNIHGSATPTGDNCFRLTSAINWDAGSIWNKTPISLKAPFEMEIDLVLGCKDHNGADGIVFVFYPEMVETGFAGEGIGFGGLNPALGIEVDTYENPHLYDPWYDHIAIMANGNINHRFSLIRPVQASASSANIEDCGKHRLRVTWEPALELLKVYLDGSLRAKLNMDLTQKIFRGNPDVYWGFTSATGGQNNRHEICLEKIIYEEAKPKDAFTKTEEKMLLEGEMISLDNVNFESGKATLLPESLTDLEKLLSFMRKHPKQHLTLSGHTDSIGGEKANKTLSQLRAVAIKQFLMENGISEDRISTSGYGEKFPIAPNDTAEGRKKNRRVDIYFSKLRA